MQASNRPKGGSWRVVKGSKEANTRGTVRRAPARRIRPLVNPPPHRRNYNGKSGGRRERSRRRKQGHDDVPSRRENVTRFFRCVRVGYIGEDAICRAAARHECLPCAAFFGYFLVRTQESDTLRLPINEKININLLYRFSFAVTESAAPYFADAADDHEAVRVNAAGQMFDFGKFIVGHDA